MGQIDDGLAYADEALAHAERLRYVAPEICPERSVPDREYGSGKAKVHE
jgi:hypothetical protein